MISPLRYFLKPCPSLFDLCVGCFLFIPMLHGNHDKAVFLVFYAVFLVIVSWLMKPKRQYRSLPLTLLAFWSLLGVFIHSFDIWWGSRTMLYLNYYLMVEGFLYVFFGILFVITVVKYSTNIRFILILLPFALIPWYAGLLWKGSVTPIAALGIAIVIYLFLTKRLLWGAMASGIGIVSAWLNWSWICMKFASRPLVWHQLIVNMFYHPMRRMEGVGDIHDPGIQLSPFLEKFCNNHFADFADKVKPWLAGIVGSGFSDYLDPEYTWVDKDVFGWSYKQNDYFFLAEALGPITLILMAWFIISSLRKIGIQPALILFMALIISSFFQLTMYFPDKAGIYLLIGAFAIIEGIRKRRENGENNCI